MIQTLLCEQNLSQLNAGVGSIDYPRGDIKTGIVHLGPGAFHRAHQAVYTDALLRKGSKEWGICEVSVNSSSVRDALKAQDNLYTLAILDEKIEHQLIGVITDILVAPEEPQKVIDTLALPSVKVVTMTITEKGYCLTPGGGLDFENKIIQHDLATPNMPKSALGYLMAGLKSRWEQGIPAFVAISCDNLTENGERLKRAAVDYSNAIDKGFAQWVESDVFFPCTMVDSITPATNDEVRNKVQSATALKDAWPIQREKFTQWVIEDLPGMQLPPWDTVGAVYSTDVAGFEATKLRVLNGLHTSLTFIGLLAGLESVEQATKNTSIRAFLEAALAEEIIPTLPKVHGLNATQYGASILKRFENPAIKHLLSQIAWDSSQKIPFRLLGTISDNLASGRSSFRLCFAVAAWMHFIREKTLSSSPITDPLNKQLEAIAGQCRGDRSDPKCFFESTAMFPSSLVEQKLFVDDISRAYLMLEERKSKDIFDILSVLEAG